MDASHEAALQRLRENLADDNTDLDLVSWLVAVKRDDIAALLAALDAATERVRRYEMLAAHNAAYAALRNDPEAWAAELAERVLWDVTLMDGLDDDEQPPAASPAMMGAEEGE